MLTKTPHIARSYLAILDLDILTSSLGSHEQARPTCPNMANRGLFCNGEFGSRNTPSSCHSQPFSMCAERLALTTTCGSLTPSAIANAKRATMLELGHEGCDAAIMCSVSPGTGGCPRIQSSEELENAELETLPRGRVARL